MIRQKRPIITPHWLAMPEAHALRKIHWQFFVTLTFQSDCLSWATRKCLMFSWLRDVAGSVPGTHFKKLLWVARFECGRGLRGHFHLCFAGIPSAFPTLALCKQLEAAWTNRTRGRAEVVLYDHARDGVGYIVKIPPTSPRASDRCGVSFSTKNEDTNPTLSNSLFATLRRGRM